MKIKSEFAVLDVLGKDEDLYYRYAASDARTRVTIHGHIVGIWGDHDGKSREYHVEVDKVHAGQRVVIRRYYEDELGDHVDTMTVEHYIRDCTSLGSAFAKHVQDMTELGHLDAEGTAFLLNLDGDLFRAEND